MKLVNMLTEHAAPLLAARLVTWRHVERLDGVILYSVTPEGRANATKGNAAAWFKRITRPKSYPLPAAYCEGWERAYAQRPHAKPARPNMVHHLDPIAPPRRDAGPRRVKDFRLA